MTRESVPSDLDGERTDKIVAILAGCSRAEARTLVDSGEVRSGDRVLEARERLAAGTSIEFERPADRGPLLRAEPVDFGVVHEDGWLLVVDKPAGLVVHPGAGRHGPTLAGGLLYRFPELEGVGEPDRWGIVHRLDRETSGLLVVARTSEAHTALTRMIRRHEIEREYAALVAGSFDLPRGTVDAPIAADPSRPTRRTVGAEGRPSVTHYAVEAAWPDATLLRVTLETGRTHQIRVHLAAIDHPVIGDKVYGRPWSVDSPRVFLHARRLAFTHPGTGDGVEFASPLPADLSEVLESLGTPRSPEA